MATRPPFDGENAPPPGSSLSEHIDHNIESVVALQRRKWESISPSQRQVERISRFMARPAYLYVVLLIIGAWVGLNIALRVLRISPWDPPPFELLDGLMTLVSLVTTTVVLIAQQRQAKLEEQHTHLDLQVNLLTEQKVTKLIHLVEELRRDMPMVKDRHDPQADALKERTDTAQVITAIEEGLASVGEPKGTSNSGPGKSGPRP